MHPDSIIFLGGRVQKTGPLLAASSSRKTEPAEGSHVSGIAAEHRIFEELLQPRLYLRRPFRLRFDKIKPLEVY